MSRIYTIMPFQVSPEFKEKFKEEAKRLDIDMTELFHRSFRTWMNVTSEEEKRKKRAVTSPQNPAVRP